MCHSWGGGGDIRAMEETNHIKLRGLNILGRGEQICKGPVVGMNLLTGIAGRRHRTWSKAGEEASGVKMKSRPLAETGLRTEVRFQVDGLPQEVIFVFPMVLENALCKSFYFLEPLLYPL